MYDTSERGRSMKLGADVPWFALKQKYEEKPFESHVTADVSTFLLKNIFSKKLMQIIYHAIQNQMLIKVCNRTMA